MRTVNTPIVCIEGNMNKELYTEILEDDVLGSFHDLGLNYHHFYFQHDNDPKHTSKLLQQWFTNKNMDVLPWPPNSPDINIIENLWDHLAHRIQARSPHPTSEEDLWVLLQEEWYHIDTSFITNLYNSLPQRVFDIYKAKGGTRLQKVKHQILSSASRLRGNSHFGYTPIFRMIFVIKCFWPHPMDSNHTFFST